MTTPLPPVPIYNASLDEMNELPSLISSLSSTLTRFGAVVVKPPSLWKPPPPTLNDNSTFSIHEQVFPTPPFADSAVLAKVQGFLHRSQQTVNRLIQDENGRVTDLSMIDDNLEDKNFVVYSEPCSFRHHRERSRKKELVILQSFKNDAISPIHDEHNVSEDQIEHVFWSLTKSGLDGKPFRLWYGAHVGMDSIRTLPRQDKRNKRRIITSDDEEDAPSNSDNTATVSNAKWHIGNINNFGLLRHTDTMHGINVPMYYVGGAFSIFHYHVEDEDLCSVSYLHQGSSKFWYVCPPAFRREFEELVATHILNPAFVNMYHGGARQFLSEKSCIFNPSLARRHGYDIPFYKASQQPGTFIILPPCAYHGGFNSGFNVAEAVNYADMSWLTPARVTAKTTAIERLSSQVALPIEFMLWKEAEAIIRKDGYGSKEILLDMAKRLHEALTTTFRQAGKKVHHHTRGDSTKIVSFGSIDIVGSFEERGLPCAMCRRPAYFFFQICQTCCNAAHVRCISHLASDRYEICNIPSHHMVIVRRFAEDEIVNCLRKLAAFAPSVASNLRQTTNASQSNASTTTSEHPTSGSSGKKSTTSRNNRRSKKRKMKNSK